MCHLARCHRARSDFSESSPHRRTHYYTTIIECSSIARCHEGNTSSPIARCLQCTTTFRRRRRCTPHLRTTVSSRIRSSMALCQSPQSTRDLLGPHTVVVSYSQ